jgi:hypothetical protein
MKALNTKALNTKLGISKQMSKRSRRPVQKLGFLKATLILGSMAATMLGADLLAGRDQNPANSLQPSVAVVVPVQQGQQQVLNINDVPASRLVFPRAIARSRSSR